MVAKEIILLFTGRNHRFFGSAAVIGGDCGRIVLRAFIFADCCDYCEDACVGRSGVGMAVAGMYYFYGQRCTAFVYGNCGTVSFKDLS